MEILFRNIKVALVGDAGVGKTSWVKVGISDEYSDDYIPTINYESRLRDIVTTLGRCILDIWDISGSHSTAQDRAKWLEDSDATIIMVDLANQESINNTILWYREIISSQLQSDIPKHLPITVFAYEAYRDDAKYKIKPTEISWSEEMGSTPFHYNKYVDETIRETDEDQYWMMFMGNESTMKRPLQWILEQLTGQPEVDFNNNLHFPHPIGPWNLIPDEKFEKYKREMEEVNMMVLPNDDDADL